MLQERKGEIKAGVGPRYGEDDISPKNIAALGDIPHCAPEL